MQVSYENVLLLYDHLRDGKQRGDAGHGPGPGEHVHGELLPAPAVEHQPAHVVPGQGGEDTCWVTCHVSPVHAGGRGAHVVVPVVTLAVCSATTNLANNGECETEEAILHHPLTILYMWSRKCSLAATLLVLVLVIISRMTAVM